MRFFIALLVVTLVVTLPCLSMAGTLTQDAIKEYNLENYEEALVILIKARDAGEGTTLNDYYTGMCHKQAGNYEEAVKHFTRAVREEPPIKDAGFELIAALVVLERPDEALLWIKWAEKEQIRPKEVAFQKGLILSKKKQFKEAIEALEAAKNGNPTLDQQIDLLIALAYDQNGSKQEARASLKAIITRYPGTDVATFAQEYEQRMSTAGPVKNLRLFFGLSYQYDDNVTYQSTSRLPDAPDSDDNALNINLRVEYDKPLTTAWSTNLQYAVANTMYGRLHESNLLINSVTASAIHNHETFITNLPFNIMHVAKANMLAYRYMGNSTQYSFKPSGTIIFTPQSLGMITLGYSRREMSQPSSLPETSNDANIYNGQVGYIFLFDEGRGMINLRGEIFYEQAKGFEQRNFGKRAGVDLLVPLTKNTKLNLSAEGTWNDYLESAAERKDNIVNATASINQKISDNFYLNVNYGYSRALSNIDLYDYQHNMVSIGMELRY